MPAALRFQLARWLSRSLAAPAAFGLAEWAADLQWRLSPRERAAVQANLSMVLQQVTADDSPLIRDVFRHFARYLVEFFTIDRVAAPALVLDGEAHLRAAARHGRGVLLLTAHLGNWEAGAIMVHRLGFRVAAVAMPHHQAATDRLFRQQRERCGVETIPLGRGAASRCLRMLRRGDVVGVLGDRNVTGQGITAACWGRRLLLPRGPATLSLRSGAPVVPAFLIREGRWAFRLCCEPAIWPDRVEGRRIPIAQLTQRYADVMAHYIRRCATQWVMFQRIGT